ncbi:MAG: radical SAM protein [Bryobacteraceae bacterium]|nr:radical SAM protein [Bryobacteraceae bacterium]
MVLFPECKPSAGLVGIARMAAEADLLEAKRRVEYRELESKSLVSRVSNPWMPFRWTINPYRGCEFGCKYCYARYTHEFMELRDTDQFETLIFAKHFDAAAFRRELARIPREDKIAIGTATDPYQPAERRYGVTRQILEALTTERGRAFSIISKSDLIARDADVFTEIARYNTMHVMQTITTVDTALARILEPSAPRPELRVESVRRLASAGLGVVVMNSPVLPLINDSRQSLAAVASAVRQAGASYFTAQTLFLKECARKAFFPMLEAKFPHLVRKYRERYGTGSGYLKGAYPEMIAERVRSVREEFGLTRKLQDAPPDVWIAEVDQLSLFG